MTKKNAKVEVVKDASVVPPEEVAKRVVCLVLSFSHFGVRRKVDPKKVMAAPSEALGPDARESVHVGKDILESEALGDVAKMAGEARMFVRNEEVPAKFLRGGMYLVPALRLEAIEEKLKGCEGKYGILVDAFMSEYDSGRIQEAARKRLEPLGLFDAKDYPSSASVRGCFRMRWRWLEFSVPDKLRETNPALWAAEMKKSQEMWAEASAEIKAGLREVAQGIVAKLVARLEPGEDGKRKALRAETFAPLSEFLESFPFKNVTGDEELRTELDKLRALTKGVDVDDLKRYGGLRNKLRADLEVASSRLEQLVEEAPERRISFDDEAA